MELTALPSGYVSGFVYGYNNQQNVSSVTNGRGDVIALSYDGDERVSGVSFPTTSQPSISVNYDADSRVQSFTDGIGTTTYTYAVNGWLTKVVYNYSASGLSNAQELDYGYYPDGRRETLTWKNGSNTVGTWTYTYDSAGRLTGVANPWSESTGYTYDGESKLLTQDDSNGLDIGYTYNNATGWPTSITDTVAGSTIASYALTYDNGSNTVGNLTGVTEADGSAVSYDYDALYRLTTEERTGTAADSHSFSYDLAGNRTDADGSALTFDNANKITNSGYTYDGDGDLTSDGTTSYTWDDRGDMLSRTAGGTTLTYGYDARGLRVESSAGGGTFYIFDGGVLLGEVSSSGTVEAAYTWGAAGLVSERLVPSSTSLWYGFGPQGETRLLTNSSGSVVDSYVYSAYGQSIASSGTDTNPFQYGGEFGYYTDSADPGGAVLCTHRWYDPSAGRWISRDPIGYDGGVNLYNYCDSDPITCIDPSGYDVIDQGIITISTTLGGLMGGVLGGTAGATTGGVVIPIVGFLPGGVAGTIGGAAGGAAVGAGVGAIIVGIRHHGFPAIPIPPIHWGPPSTTLSVPALPPVMPIRGGSGSNLPGPSQGGPSNGSVVQDNGNGTGTIRDYGPDGKPIKDIDFGHDHGSGDPHCHDWSYPSGSKGVRGPHRPLLPGE